MKFYPLITGLVLLFILISCSKNLTETPEGALQFAQESYLAKDAKKFTSILSDESKQKLEERIEPIRAMFQNVPGEGPARKAYSRMAEKMGISIENLGKLTIEDYITYSLKNDMGQGSETTIFPKEFLKKPAISKKEEKGDTVILHFGNMGRLVFLKTGKGYRLHLDAEKLSDKDIPKPIEP